MMDVVIDTLEPLFKPGITSSVARKINKDHHDALQSKWCDDIAVHVSKQLAEFLQKDKIEGLLAVPMLVECRCCIQRGCQLCTTEILVAALYHISSKQIGIYKNQSVLQIACKAVYCVLQHLMPTDIKELTEEQKQLILKILSELLDVVHGNTVSSHCAIISSTSVSLCISLLYQENAAECFFQILRIAAEDKRKDSFLTILRKVKETKETVLENDMNIELEHLPLLKFDGIKVNYSVLILLYGLFNSGVDWIYQAVSVKDVESVSIDSTKNSSIVTSPSNRLMKTFVYSVFVLIEQLCLVPSNFTYQAFQCLFLWLTCIRKQGLEKVCSQNRYKERVDNNIKSDSSCAEERDQGNCWQEKITRNYRSEDHFSLDIFSLDPKGTKTVFHLLNSNWENPAKGVSDIVRDSMEELILIHEDVLTGKAEEICESLLSALVESATWSSKSTYLPLHLILKYINCDKVMRKYPDFPSCLAVSLSVNHLAPVGANVYKQLLSQICVEDWEEHFMPVFLETLHGENGMKKIHLKSLWLPVTLKKFPNLLYKLLSHCNSGEKRVEAFASLIKVARMQGCLDLFGDRSEYDKEKLLQNNVTSKIHLDDNSEMMDMKSQHDTDNTRFYEIIREALYHEDESVRGDALAVVCQTPKASQPLCQEEASLLKEFFKWNMNIDSSPFRQVIVKNYKAAVARMRDACAVELKGKPTTHNDGQVSSILDINSSLIIWFIWFFHNNLKTVSNYQRRVLSLQLYRETLTAFLTPDKKSGNFGISRYFGVRKFISCRSAIVAKQFKTEEPDRLFWFVSQSVQPVRDFTLPYTLDMLLHCCQDEMNDIREEAEEIIKLIVTPLSGNLAPDEATQAIVNNRSLNHWLQTGLGLCDSPKASEAESGSAIIQVVTNIMENTGIAFSLLVEDGCQSAASVRCSIFLYNRVMEQFETAKMNFLNAARMQPIHGTLLALGRCLCENVSLEKSCADEINEIVQKVVKMLTLMIEFILCKLGLDTSSSSVSAPSFEEMENAVAGIVRECTSEDAETECETVVFDEFCCEEVEGNFTSRNHQFVLACCWQTLKACCIVSCALVTKWFGPIMKCEEVDSLMRNVLVKVLLGTRHKGAMEAAKLMYKQVGSIICQLPPGMVILERQTEKQETVDSASSLALHVLHDLVLDASLSHQMVPHLSTITITCVMSFSSQSWSLRNAALQLYGAVVSRMVGQKKVKDDTSVLNSLTASEFMSRYPKLTDFLLKVLENGTFHTTCQQKLESSEFIHMKDFGKTSVPDISLGTSSFHLVPVLSLLCRLSPGTELHQTEGLNKIFDKYLRVLSCLLSSPVHTIRRLAAHSVLAFTPRAGDVDLCGRILSSIVKNYGSANTVHGNLLTLWLLIERNEIISNETGIQISETMEPFLTSDYKCYVNKTLALKIILVVHNQIYLGRRPEIEAVSSPGSAEYFKKAFQIYIRGSLNLQNIDKDLLSLNRDLSEACLEEFKRSVTECITKELALQLQELIWNAVDEYAGKIWHATPALDLLISLLDKFGPIYHPSESSMLNFLSFLKGSYGAKVSVQSLTILSSYIGRELCHSSEILIAWTQSLQEYAQDTCTEDYRLAAAHALKRALAPIMKNSFAIFVGDMQSTVVKCTINLLLDEDPEVRKEVCKAIFTLPCKSNPYYFQSLHPNVALHVFIHYVIDIAIKKKDIVMMQTLWISALGPQIQYEGNTTKVKKILFESHAVNLYMEPLELSQVISSAFMHYFQIYQKDEAISQFLQGRCEEHKVITETVRTVLQNHAYSNLKKFRNILLSMSCFSVISKLLQKSVKMFDIDTSVDCIEWSEKEYFTPLCIQKL
ncbi:tRNA (32-2'-O)-methyltransferase regulator THADA-like isoform X2 [Oratosquilla oratoria]|uniref:tRNA (32-2'-O)-methyltransferase regulator THADA-like isoform X2 n=1 Tax=Oratosquilla oratoria TaxID=337810 RepID=UPI003F775B44